MIKKTITYKDFNGKDRSDTFYFNLNEAEALELRFIHGDFEDTIKYLSDVQGSEDGTIDSVHARDLWSTFKEILEKSVGSKSSDGRLFIKNDEIVREFTQSNAMSQLLIEILSDTDEATKFINGLPSSSAPSGNTKTASPVISEV